MKAEKALLRVSPFPVAASDFSKTRALPRQPVFESISISRCAFMEVHLPGLRSISVELDKQEALIGRSSSCRIQLQFPDVSRLHARLTYHNEEYLIEDLGSTNGTYVNGVLVEKCVLRNNDQIQIGDAMILFVEEKSRERR